MTERTYECLLPRSADNMLKSLVLLALCNLLTPRSDEDVFSEKSTPGLAGPCGEGSGLGELGLSGIISGLHVWAEAMSTVMRFVIGGTGGGGIRC